MRFPSPHSRHLPDEGPPAEPPQAPPCSLDTPPERIVMSPNQSLRDVAPDVWACIEFLAMAINTPGPNPVHHAEVMARHRREWPTLWVAIDMLMDTRPPG